MKNVFSFIKFMSLQIVAIVISIAMVVGLILFLNGCTKQSVTPTKTESKTKLPGIISIEYHGDTTIVEFKKLGNDLMWFNDGGTAIMYKATITTDVTRTYFNLKKFQSWAYINNSLYTVCPKTCTIIATN